VGSIPIARSTFRSLACPYVALGHALTSRMVPNVFSRVEPVVGSSASFVPSVAFILDGLIGPSSTQTRRW